MKAGESVLVHGASGGVSIFSLRLFLKELTFVRFTLYFFKLFLKAKFVNIVKGAFFLFVARLL